MKASNRVAAASVTAAAPSVGMVAEPVLVDIRLSNRRWLPMA